ncbi:MAG: glucose-1-phosphate thymidylyltransferase [Deltaproteobacteria bacterium]|nr:glucose-1-phosphate thymidylyltransferase [Deltaproteobacteria bacterium]
MKGLVLAGGSGTRLRPLTYTGAKQLVPVANRPVLFYVVDNLVEAGVTDIGVIISPETGGEIRAALGDGTKLGAKFSFIVQDRPGGLAHAVLCARPFLEGADFVMYLGDNLIGTSIREPVAEFSLRRELAASLMLKEVPNPSAFGVAEVDSAGNVIGLVEKPKEPRSNLALVGIYLFRPSIFEAIGKIEPSARGELEITDAVSALIDLGGKVNFARVTSWWLDTGKKDDLLLANDTVLDDWLEAECQGEVDGASRISGRVRIGRGARIVRSTVRGPTVIGEDVLVADSRVGPFTALGDGVRIERSTVEHSVIMQHSSVTDIARLEDSLLGRRVVVRPGASRHTRGPHEHVHQTDWFCFLGPSRFLLVLWDNRPSSPTCGNSMRLVVGEDNPAGVIVPPGVVHGYRNVGEKDGLVLNFPDRLFQGAGRREPVDEVRHEADPSSPFRMDECRASEVGPALPPRDVPPARSQEARRNRGRTSGGRHEP